MSSDMNSKSANDEQSAGNGAAEVAAPVPDGNAPPAAQPDAASAAPSTAVPPPAATQDDEEEAADEEDEEEEDDGDDGGARGVLPVPFPVAPPVRVCSSYPRTVDSLPVERVFDMVREDWNARCGGDMEWDRETVMVAQRYADRMAHYLLYCAYNDGQKESSNVSAESKPNGSGSDTVDGEKKKPAAPGIHLRFDWSTPAVLSRIAEIESEADDSYHRKQLGSRSPAMHQAVDRWIADFEAGMQLEEEEEREGGNKAAAATTASTGGAGAEDAAGAGAASVAAASAAVSARPSSSLRRLPDWARSVEAKERLYMLPLIFVYHLLSASRGAKVSLADLWLAAHSACITRNDPTGETGYWKGLLSLWKFFAVGWEPTTRTGQSLEKFMQHKVEDERFPAEPCKIILQWRETRF